MVERQGTLGEDDDRKPEFCSASLRPRKSQQPLSEKHAQHETKVEEHIQTYPKHWNIVKKR
jgi:hypothetical protein